MTSKRRTASTHKQPHWSEIAEFLDLKGHTSACNQLSLRLKPVYRRPRERNWEAANEENKNDPEQKQETIQLQKARLRCG